MKKYLVAAALFMAFGAANATPFRTVAANNNHSTNGSWSFGTIFTVGANSVDVYSLGAYDEGHNGFVSNAIEVGIFNETTHALLASTNVLSSNTLVGDYRYASISNLTLVSGQQYRLVAVSRNDIYSYPTSTYDAAFTVNGFGYCNTTTLTSCQSNTENDYGMGNFQYQLAANRVPEPGSLALLGLGLAGFAAARRRKQA